MGRRLPNLVLLVTLSSPRRVELTLGEWRVLRLVALGCNRRQIAVLLDRSVEVVQQCQAQLKRKTGTTTLRALARWARQKTLCPTDDRFSPVERARLATLDRPID